MTLDLIGEDRAATMSARVFAAVRSAIVRLQLRPGHSLSEAEIARELGISRQPVREAFIKLAEAGLVEIRPQRGTFVKLISMREVKNSRFIREAIEMAVVRKAAAGIDGSGVANLRDIVRAQVGALEGGLGEFMRLDDTFHSAIAGLADCEHAWRHIEALKAQLDRVRFLGFPDATPRPQVVAQHAKIVDALEQRDGDAASAMMYKHLNEIMPSLTQMAETHPDLFAD